MFTMTSTGEMLDRIRGGASGQAGRRRSRPRAHGDRSRDRRVGGNCGRNDDCSLTERQIEQLRLVGLAARDGVWRRAGRGVGDRCGAARSTSSSRGRSRRRVTIPVAPAATGRRISWSNANVNENFPRPISPLLYSIASAGYTHYFRNLAVACGVSPARVRAMEPAFQQIIGVHGARMYYNLTSIHSVLRLAPFGDALTKSFDAFVGADGGAVETTDGRSAGHGSSGGRDRGHRRSRDCLVAPARPAHRAVRANGGRVRGARRAVAARATVARRAARVTRRVHRDSLPQVAGRVLGRRGGDDQLRRARAAVARLREWTPPCTRRCSRPFRTS